MTQINNFFKVIFYLLTHYELTGQIYWKNRQKLQIAYWIWVMGPTKFWRFLRIQIDQEDIHFFSTQNHTKIYIANFCKEQRYIYHILKEWTLFYQKKISGSSIEFFTVYESTHVRNFGLWVILGPKNFFLNFFPKPISKFRF